MTVCAACHYEIYSVGETWLIAPCDLSRAWADNARCRYHRPIDLPVVLRDLVAVLFS